MFSDEWMTEVGRELCFPRNLIDDRCWEELCFSGNLIGDRGGGGAVFSE